MAAYCNATTRRGTPCQRPAGWGTDHTGAGRCKLHGGAGGAPEHNKNALKTGEYETIWLDQLDADEQTLIGRINPDALAQLDDEIRLATIRERRMLARIAELAAVDFTVVERHHEHREGFDAGKASEGDEGGAGTLVDITTTKEVSHGTLGQIQHIEQALTRVQQTKIRLIELRHRLAGGDGEDDALAELVAVIARSRQDIERRRDETVNGE